MVGHNTRGYTVDNYRWSVEPASYYATDLTAVRDGRDVDAASFDVYRVKADEPPLMLTQVPRPARTSMLLRIDDAEPSVDTSPSTPVAVLQAPPTVRGLGQQRDFTPEFATSAATGQSATEGKSTKLGAHVEASVVGTAGAGFLGNNVRAGGGVSVGFQFMNEVEKSLTRAVEVATTEGYGGSFAHHTLVTRAIKEYVWRGTVVSDPAGFATGQPFTYRLPVGEVTQAVPLTQLAREHPLLYGEGGLFTASLSRMMNNFQVGDPGTYLPGAQDTQPSSIVSSQGGPARAVTRGTGTRRPSRASCPR